MYVCPLNRDIYIYIYIYICRYAMATSIVAGYILSGVSLLTVTAISVDRLLALLLRIRYRHTVNLKRAYIAVFVLWVVPIVGLRNNILYYCLVILWYDNATMFICQVTLIFCYTKLFITLRHNQI